MGFFHTQWEEGRWLLIDPHGEHFFSTGLSYVSYRGYVIGGTQISPYTVAINKKYGSRHRWAKATAKNMIAWGFNTLGAWSDNDLAKENIGGDHLVYTTVLNLGAGFVEQKGKAAWLEGIFPDVFDPDFIIFCHKEIRKQCRPFRHDPDLLGWFIDNELRWGPDLRASDELLVSFLNLPRQAPGRKVALDLLRRRYPTIAQFNQVWGTSFLSWEKASLALKFGTPPNADRARGSASNAKAFIADCDAFLGLLAQKYFQVTREAIKSVDPNHLVLGCRFASVPAEPVLVAAAKYSDVITLNCYQSDPGNELKEYSTQNKPLLISEFSFRAKDSGCPNTKGAGPIVATQQDRATSFEAYARAALSNPNVIGYHWFDLADEPKEGRFDGENSNNGVVDIHDNPYAILVGKMTEINYEA
jgi:Beta-galactosidase